MNERLATKIFVKYLNNPSLKNYTVEKLAKWSIKDALVFEEVLKGYWSNVDNTHKSSSLEASVEATYEELDE